MLPCRHTSFAPSVAVDCAGSFALSFSSSRHPSFGWEVSATGSERSAPSDGSEVIGASVAAVAAAAVAAAVAVANAAAAAAREARTENRDLLPGPSSRRVDNPTLSSSRSIF